MDVVQDILCGIQLQGLTWSSAIILMDAMGDSVTLADGRVFSKLGLGLFFVRQYPYARLYTAYKMQKNDTCEIDGIVHSCLSLALSYFEITGRVSDSNDCLALLEVINKVGHEGSVFIQGKAYTRMQIALQGLRQDVMYTSTQLRLKIHLATFMNAGQRVSICPALSPKEEHTRVSLLLSVLNERSMCLSDDVKKNVLVQLKTFLPPKASLVVDVSGVKIVHCDE